MSEASTGLERAILDTSVVISTDIEPLPGVLAISAATLAELQFGVLVARTPEARSERLRRLSILQQRFDALPIDETVAMNDPPHFSGAGGRLGGPRGSLR